MKDKQDVRNFIGRIYFLEQRIYSFEKSLESVSRDGGIAAASKEAVQDDLVFHIDAEFLIPYMEKEIVNCKAELETRNEQLRRILEIIKEEI